MTFRQRRNWPLPLGNNHKTGYCWKFITKQLHKNIVFTGCYLSSGNCWLFLRLWSCRDLQVVFLCFWYLGFFLLPCCQCPHFIILFTFCDQRCGGAPARQRLCAAALLDILSLSSLLSMLTHNSQFHKIESRLHYAFQPNLCIWKFSRYLQIFSLPNLGSQKTATLGSILWWSCRE